MAEGEENEGMLVARIIIERRVTEEDIIDHVNSENGEGELLNLSEALGMMRLAEDTLLRMHRTLDDGDDGG